MELDFQFGPYLQLGFEDDSSETLCGSSPTTVSELPAEKESLDENDTQYVYSQSSTFHPRAGLDQQPPYTILLSSDYTLFHVHRHRLAALSKNDFNGLLSSTTPMDTMTPQVIPVDEDATVLCIVLNVIYNMPLDPHCSSFESLCSAVSTFKKYSMSLQDIMLPRAPFADRLLAYAPLRAIELYALAAEHNAEGLAASASSYLLSYRLANLTDHLAIQMGADYLQRLFGLQSMRKLELRRLLFNALDFHPSTRTCDLINQKKLHRAWALLSARLAWEMGPDVSVTVLQRSSAEVELSCPECRAILNAQMKSIVRTWSLCCRTI